MRDSPRGELTSKQILICGATSGIGASFVLTPIELVKTRMQIQGQAGEKLLYSSTVDCVKQLIRNEGFLSLWRGITATACRDVPGLASYFTIYNYFKLKYSTKTPSGHLVMPVSVQIFAGGFAGVLSWIVSLPPDIIKSRLQVQDSKLKLYNGFWDCVIKSYRQEGILVFYRGIGPALVRAFPVNATIFFVFDGVMRAF